MGTRDLSLLCHPSLLLSGQWRIFPEQYCGQSGKLTTPLLSPKVENEWGYTSPPPHVPSQPCKGKLCLCLYICNKTAPLILCTVFKYALKIRFISEDCGGYTCSPNFSASDITELFVLWSAELVCKLSLPQFIC